MRHRCTGDGLHAHHGTRCFPHHDRTGPQCCIHQGSRLPYLGNFVGLTLLCGEECRDDCVAEGSVCVSRRWAARFQTGDVRSWQGSLGRCCCGDREHRSFKYLDSRVMLVLESFP